MTRPGLPTAKTPYVILQVLGLLVGSLCLSTSAIERKQAVPPAEVSGFILGDSIRQFEAKNKRRLKDWGPGPFPHPGELLGQLPGPLFESFNATFREDKLVYVHFMRYVPEAQITSAYDTILSLTLKSYGRPNVLRISTDMDEPRPDIIWQAQGFRILLNFAPRPMPYKGGKRGYYTLTFVAVDPKEPDLYQSYRPFDLATAEKVLQPIQAQIAAITGVKDRVPVDLTPTAPTPAKRTEPTTGEK